MNRAVFDTNVLVAGFLSPAGPPGRIVEWLRAGSVVAVLDDRIFAEYAEVLARPAFCLPTSEVNIVLDAIRARATWAEVGAGYRILLPDPDNLPFAECAHEAEVPLVTGNLRRFPKPACRGVRVLTSAQFLALAGAK
jgi:predicted nucleic acid-binding protein